MRRLNVCFKQIPLSLFPPQSVLFHFWIYLFSPFFSPTLFILTRSYVITRVCPIPSCSVSPHLWRPYCPHQPFQFISVFRCDDDAGPLKCVHIVASRRVRCGRREPSFSRAAVFVCIIFVSSVSVSLTTSDSHWMRIACTTLTSQVHSISAFRHDYLMLVIALPPILFRLQRIMMLQLPYGVRTLTFQWHLYVDWARPTANEQSIHLSRMHIRQFSWQLGPTPAGREPHWHWHKRQAVLPIYRWKLCKYLNVLKKRRLFTLVTNDRRAGNEREGNGDTVRCAVRMIFTMTNKTNAASCLHKNKCHCKWYRFSDSFLFDSPLEISNTKRANINFYTYGVTHS